MSREHTVVQGYAGFWCYQQYSATVKISTETVEGKSVAFPRVSHVLHVGNITIHSNIQYGYR